MHKLIRLSPTGIEYGDYAWNFASGCGNNIDGKCKSGGFNCWAYSITQRFGGHYPNGFSPTVYPDALLSPLYLKKPSKILCAFMGDLFGDWFDPDEKIEALMPSQKASIKMSLKGWIYTTIKQCPQHTFLFLTKQPQNLPKWSPFPSNCFVGVTATNDVMLTKAWQSLKDTQAKVKYLSIEPLLNWGMSVKDTEWTIRDAGINWLIIGSQTTPYRPPKIESVEDISKACVNAGIPLFLKDNLRPLLEPSHIVLRQEMPKV